jgi:peptidoglycan/LPS O-acetylase OafA/YrhL
LNCATSVRALPSKKVAVHRPDIDGLRAIAVLFVIGFHAFPHIFSGGFVGVDIFFVISGFLISGLIFSGIKNAKFSLVEFYSRRVNRLFPALLTVLISAGLIGLCSFVPEDFGKLAKHIFGGAGFVANYLYRSEVGYFDEAADLKPLLHLWSLGVEEQFYIVWPLVVLIALRLKVNILMLIFALGMGSFFYGLFRLETYPAYAFYMPQTRAWELLLGATIAWVAPLTRNVSVGHVECSHMLSALGFCLLLAGLSMINKASQFPGWWALIPTIGATCMLAAGPTAFLNRTILSSKPLRWIGNISYPLYLWHWVCLSIPTIVFSTPLSTLPRVGLIGLSFLLAFITYRYVETPIRLRHNHPRTAGVLLLVMVLLGTLAFICFKKEGFIGQTSTPRLIDNTGVHPCGTSFSKNELCMFGNPTANETILIYGDSHAQHLTAAMNEVFGKTYKLIFAFNPSCFFGAHPSPNYEPPNACKPFIQQVKQLTGLHFKAIIRSQRWHGYGITNPDQITAAVNDATLAFGLHADKIVIVGSTADINLKCEKHNYYFESAWMKQDCQLFSDSILANKQFVDVTSKRQQQENIIFIYPYNKLCPGDVCMARDNQIQFYGDSHHLTKDGALLVVRDIKKAIEP